MPMVRVIIVPQSPPWVTDWGVSGVSEKERLGWRGTVLVVAELEHEFVACLCILG